jgi:hypothetical protein
MTIIYTTTTDGTDFQPLCEGDSDPQQDFCSGDSLDSYIRMCKFVSRLPRLFVCLCSYLTILWLDPDGLLLGDFEVNDYRGDKSTTVVFLVFTMFGVIILLNVLIAVVSDSYEKSTVSAKALFGKARIGFLAEHFALEQFLQPGSNPWVGINQEGSALDPRRCASIAGRTLRWVVLLGLLVTGLFAEVFLVGQAVTTVFQGRTNILLAIMLGCMAFVLTIALWTVFGYLFSSVFAGLNCKLPILHSIDRVVRRSVDFLRNAVFGEFSIADSNDENDEWTGRLDYLEKAMTRIVTESEQNLTMRIQTAENSLKEYEKKLAEKNSAKVELRNDRGKAASK